MSISVTCSECGKGLKAPDALAGKQAKCPQCGSVVPIPAATVDAEDDYGLPAKKPSSKSKARPADEYSDEDEASDDSGSEESDDGRKPCPMCGEMIASAAAKCRFCGEVFDARVGKRGQKRGASDDYASFWLRLAAAIVDGIIVQIIVFPFSFVAGLIIGAAAGGGGNPQQQQQMVFFAQMVGAVIGLVIGWLYSALQESSAKQATVGKKMLGIRVTDMDGNRISFGKASGRHFGKILSGLICAIGYIMAGFTEKKQALHDIMAGTLVVKD